MKTILITGATAGFGEPRQSVSPAEAGESSAPAAAPSGCASCRRSSATRSCRSTSTCAIARRSKAWRDSTPWSEIDLLLNNAGLATPTDPLPEPTGNGSRM